VHVGGVRVDTIHMHEWARGQTLGAILQGTSTLGGFFVCLVGCFFFILILINQALSPGHKVYQLD
jgi:hypothetical protein